MFKTPSRNIKKLQLDVVNGFIHIHDIACSCNEPGYHTLQIAINQIGKDLTKQQRNQLIKCLGENTTGDAADGDADLQFGDLDALFAEGGEEDPTG